MNAQDVFPSGWYLHMWQKGRNGGGCMQTGVAPGLLKQVFHVRRTSGHNSRDLEAAVAARVEP